MNFLFVDRSVSHADSSGWEKDRNKAKRQRNRVLMYLLFDPARNETKEGKKITSSAVSYISFRTSTSTRLLNVKRAMSFSAPSLVMEISRVSYRSKIVLSQRSKTPKFADRIRNLDRYNSDTQALSGRVCKFARRKVQTTRYRFISSFLLPDVRHWSNQSSIDPR